MWPTPTGAPHRPTVGGCNLLATVALELLRAGADLLTLQRLLGYTDLSIIKRCVKQTTEDLRAAHAASSPWTGRGCRQTLPHRSQNEHLRYLFFQTCYTHYITVSEGKNPMPDEKPTSDGVEGNLIWPLEDGIPTV